MLTNLTPSPTSSSSANNKESWKTVLLSRKRRRRKEKGERKKGKRKKSIMRGWKDLGMVDTIYEEEEASNSSSSLTTPSPTATPTPPHSSTSTPSTSLHARVQEWSEATGCKTDVVIRVQDQNFHLHKQPLMSRSGYLRRQLTESSDITVSPPWNVTEDTFAAVAVFCYRSDVAVTPFNVAALRLAAEWLEMTEDDGCGGGNLLQKTEGYFCRAVAANEEHASTVLRKCLALLPEAEETACLASRCLEVLALADGADGGNVGWLDDVASICPKDFQMIANFMRTRFTQNHDLLYRIVDHYLQNKRGKLTEEEKNLICYTVDCKKLSHRHLIHLVQNPAMPLRIVVQAMLVEQLHTRRSIFDRVRKPRDNSSVTLGAILQRDAALRQVTHLKASMEATSFRIQSLERDLAHMRRRLRESEEKGSASGSAQPARSESLRFFGPEEKVDIERLVSAPKPCKIGNAKGGKNFGQRLIHGFKNVFRPAKLGSESQDTIGGSEGAKEQIVVVEPRQPAHRRNHSFT